MRRKRQFVTARPEPGELYLFHPTDRSCPAGESLWGIFDRYSGSDLCLETSSRDLCSFRRWQCVPAHKWRFWRRSTRPELRDYIYNLAAWEQEAPAE